MLRSITPFRPPLPEYSGSPISSDNVLRIPAAVCPTQSCERSGHVAVVERFPFDRDKFTFHLPFPLHTYLTEDVLNVRSPAYLTKQGLELGKLLMGIEDLTNAGFQRHALHISFAKALGSEATMPLVEQAIRETGCPDLRFQTISNDTGFRK